MLIQIKEEARRARERGVDWAAMARRTQEQAPWWCVVWVDPRQDRWTGRARHAREQLARYGCRAETRAIRGGSEVPWRGWVVYARLRV